MFDSWRMRRDFMKVKAEGRCRLKAEARGDVESVESF